MGGGGILKYFEKCDFSAGEKKNGVFKFAFLPAEPECNIIEWGNFLMVAGKRGGW